ncbi:MAG TPA: thioredoxin reductase, partial [Clostridiales bacterium UBA8960]|nr:thioredoxin reductase [Clostridiales bacterium UBA8960]
MDLKLNMDLGVGKKGVNFDKTKLYDLIIIGLGPAGLNSALYAKRKGLEV